jgi:hypothetical protein
MMDLKEQAEREEAAKRYSAEDEKHFVSYLLDCVNTTQQQQRTIREVQANLYDMFLEKEPDHYAEKEEWQSRTVIPRPFSTVHSGAAAIKKAFSPDFLSVQDADKPKAGEFWKRVLEIQLDPGHADFPMQYVDALVMAMSVGESMEMIPVFQNGKLRFELVEPWKIYRDPDAPRRNPQGGLYWIHMEWLGFLSAQARGKNREIQGR